MPEKPLLDGLAPGNDYDVCSSEVILGRMRVEQGRIVLPDGMSYAALVLPEQVHIPAEVLAKIHALAAKGATVIGHQRPTRSPDLRDRESETAKVLRLAGELWGQAEMPAKQDTSDVLIRPIKKGRFIVARDRTAALRKIGVAPRILKLRDTTKRTWGLWTSSTGKPQKRIAISSITERRKPRP